MARKGQQELNPPTTFWGKVGQAVVDWIEDRISNNSHFGDPAVYKNEDFPWAKTIEAATPQIRAELDEVLQRRDELPAFHEITSEVATITTDQNWKTFVFHGYGVTCDENLQVCPKTAEVLQKIPGMKTAFFSILSPGKHIPAHRGPYNGVLRYHLGVIVPTQREQCRIRIGEDMCTWEEGKSLIFDDSYDHEVWNETDEQRVVLFVDFVRPTKFPINIINRTLLKLAVFMPFIKEAKENTRKWSERFYGDQARAQQEASPSDQAPVTDVQTENSPELEEEKQPAPV